MNTFTKLKTAEMSSFQGQTSLFWPIKPRQWYSYRFSKIPKWDQWSWRWRKYKLHCSEVTTHIIFVWEPLLILVICQSMPGYRYMKQKLKLMQPLYIQSNFNSLNIFGIPEICSRHGYFQPLRIYHGPRPVLFVLRFYGPVNPMGLCQVQSVYLTTHLLGRLSPLSG